MRHASDWGLEPSSPKITPKSIMDSMRESQRIAGRHDDPEKFRQLGIDVIEDVVNSFRSERVLAKV